MRKELVVSIIAGIGLLFSGFLTLQKLTTTTCLLTEGCTNVLGLPACLYGFVLFSAIFAISLILHFQKTHPAPAYTSLFFVTIVGIVFSGALSMKELFFPTCNPCTYTLLIPACVYGLVLYVLILVRLIKR